MTPSEAKALGGAAHITAKKMGNDTVNRKASFKCHVPNKATSQRVTRKAVRPMSTVQALTFKFNELSQMNQVQKQKISHSAVKNMLGANGGKPNTIKVVICRKPSTSKYKRSDDTVVTRKRISVRKFQNVEIDGKENNFHRNVLQKISEYEGMKKTANESLLNKKRTIKMQMPKILVDIDLSGNNCSDHKTLNSDQNGANESEASCEKNSISVRTAINIFEKSSNASVNDKKNSNANIKPREMTNKKEENEVKNCEECESQTDSSLEIKPKPIAAIKPILKKQEEKIKKTKLSPKDSMKRKKYTGMKRESVKSEESIENFEQNSEGEIVDTQNSTEVKVENKSNGADAPLANSERLKNSSSLHKHILQTYCTVIVDEIPLNEEKKEEQCANVNQNLKPNTSFLWSKKEDSPVEKKTNKIDLPLPTPPGIVPTIAENSGFIYDDVRQFDAESEEEFDKISDSEEDTYDDVGLYWRRNDKETSEKNNLLEEVRNKNIRNESSNFNVSEALYDNPEKSLYSYDDGEGERYQYISDTTDTIRTIRKQTEFEMYQYIQNYGNNNMENIKNENNIYEDIQTIKSHLEGKMKTKDIYEDINCVSNSLEDNVSIINCYEAVYNGIYSNDNGTQAYIKSDLSDASNNSGRSTYEKSNSLYGMSTGSVGDNRHCLSLSEGTDSLKHSSFHLPVYNSLHPNSESSQSNSDEWVEVSESESEETVYVVHERPKKVRSGGNSWTQKERKRWKRLQRKSKFSSEEVKLQNSDDHFYEIVGHYENAEVFSNANAKVVQSDQKESISKDQTFFEEPFVDDFDSQSSEDEAFVNAKLPDLPSHGYNITKSLKAAGQKLRKNFSLRKSDLSKSLKRFKKSRPKVSEAVFTPDNKEVEVDSSSKPDSPPTPTNLNSSIYFNNSDSSTSSYSASKNGSSDYGKSSRHRKSWTFRSKFKSSNVSDASDNPQVVDSCRNSTFYLSLNECQTKPVEKKDGLINEIESVLSQRNSISTECVYERVNRDVNLRHSDNTGNLAKSRPNVPPPPPPVTNKETTEKTKYSDLIWGEKGKSNSLYVESGLFDKQKKHSRFGDSDTFLYAEIGLYAASGDVVPNRKTQMFVDEPLYQFYTECVNQRARDDILNNYDSEGYEEINDFYSVINEKRRTIDIKNVRPNFEDFNDDVRPKVTSFRSITDRRTLWCHIPVVVDSCILETLSDQAKKLQEAKFEIVTSEASYMKSLNVLENHFMKKVSDLNMISKRDFRILFSNIVAVKKCSESFLEDLEKCWEDNIMLNGICDIVYKHATSSFQVYTKYCKNQVCTYRTLRELIDKNSNFENALKEMENDSICQNLNIHSFLMLPMQRITRLPLLMGAVLARLDKTDDEYNICKASFEVLNKIVQDCDDEARRMEKCEEMLILSQQIEFPKDIRRIPIITGSRFLVKSGQVTQLINRDENKLTFGRKFSKISLTLFLFTDLLIVAKKKNVRNYVVVDHCPRNLVQMQTTDGLSQLPVKLSANSDMGGKLLMLLTMLENHEKKTVEMILSFEMESDRQRWLEAVTPKLSENPDECIYEEWDCPQVISLYEFTPAQPDELNLCIGDVVNVLKKMNDGWYQGERLRDGAKGWFPQNHTQEISSSHVRAKNKKLRYQLLALSGNLIDSQKVNGK